MIISVDEAKRHLNVTDDTDDVLLADKIAAAEAWIDRWLETPFADLDAVPADLKEAVLMLVGHLYENREATLVGITAEEIPFGVWDLITPHRAWSF